MKQLMIAALGAVLAVLATLSAPALAVADEEIKVRLRGFEEVPAVSTVATAKFRGESNHDSIEFELSYTGLEGAVLDAHIHLGQKGVNGGIVVFLCTTPAGQLLRPAPPGTATCPASPGMVSGTLTAANVIGPAAQGIAAGQFAELVRAIRAGVTYVNVHSAAGGGANFTGGEIRGQIKADDNDD